MAQVEILTLNIDVQQLTQRLAQTRQQIEQLQAAQRTLTQSGQGTSQQFVQQSAQLRMLQQNYNSQLNVVTQLNSANAQATSATQAVNTALNVNINSIADATENSRQLTVVRNQLNLTTQEGQDALALINARLNQNTEFIRANVSAQEQQRMAIGDYSTQIQDALQNLNPFNGGIQGFTTRAQAAGGAGALLTQSFAGLTQGLIGATRAGLAFLATPIGAAIGLLAVAVGVVVGAFKFMTASMNSTEEGSQKLARVTATVTGVFNGFWKLIKPLGEFMGNTFVKYFDAAVEAVDTAVSAISSGLEFLGFEETAKSIDSFSDSIKESAQAAANLAVAEGELDKMQRKSKLTQLEYQKQAEKLRQQRDDESKSVSERIALNNQLGDVLKKQLADELLIAQQALKVANLRIQSEGKTKETLDAQAEALTEIADIQERLTGQESEQLANLNSLRKEAADAEKERQAKAVEASQKAIDKAIQQNKDEIDLFIAQQGYKKKALADELAFEESLSKKRLALLQRELKAKKISVSAFEAEKLNISNEFLQKQAEATISEAQRELELYRKNIEQKKSDDSFFTESKLLAKFQENNTLAMMSRDFQLKQKEAGLINEQQYNDAINLINDNNRIANEEAELLRQEAKKEQETIDLENKIITTQLNADNEFQARSEDLERRRIAEVEAAKKSGADVSLINAKYAAYQKELDKAIQQNKLQGIAEAAGKAAGIFKENTLAYKALAIGEATINTFLGATRALKDYAYPIGGIVAGVTVATGLASVAKIAGLKFADGGQVPVLSSGIINASQNIPTQSNSDNVLATVRRGEVILNEEQQRRAGGSSFFRSLNVPGFNGGGLVGGNSNLGNQGGYKIDMDALAVKIGEAVGQANASLPNPIVQVDSISNAQSDNTRIVSAASF